jgi:hypothetical protein
MKHFYSKSAGGFYVDEIHGSNIPADAVEITEVEHAALLNGQSEGKIIQADETGYPQALEHTYTLEEVRERKLSTLAAYRYEKEIAGITVSGATIKTDRESQVMITGAKNYSDLNPDALIDWKGTTGWVQIDRTALLAIGQAVGTHVQGCFRQEKVHAEAIAALSTITDIEAYDITTGWPG